MRQRILMCAAAVLAVLTAQARSGPQFVVVTCSAEACTFKTALSVTVAGRQTVRVAHGPAANVSPSALGGFPETNLAKMSGLYRDPASRVLYSLSPDGAATDLALPLRLAGKDAVAPGAAWQDASVEFVAAGAKTKTTATLDAVAYVLITSDAEQSVFQLMQRLIRPDQTDPRRALLIRGALEFNAKSATVARWRAALIGTIRDQLQRFEAQTGDPTTLADALHEAVQLRGIYVQVGEDSANKPLLDRVAAADDLFNRRMAVADALRSAGLWDEYLAKLRQLGLTRWSLDAFLAHVREALTTSARLHQQQALAFAKDGHFDRAFDEAGLAARNSCDKDKISGFYNARVELVNHNKIPSSPDYAGPKKVILEQKVRELEQLDPAKETVTLDSIGEGELLDPNFLPLQWKKAEFLDKLGKYAEALQVLERIERTVRLDPKQLETCLTLDGQIRSNLLDATRKSLDEMQKAFDDGRYQDALTAAATGLKADPANAQLLYFSALSAAFLRQNAAAFGFIRRYFSDANMTCQGAAESEPEKLFELQRLIAAPVVRPDPPDAVPNWLSGVRYAIRSAFYDPVSLGFLQPVTRVVSVHDGLTTLFRREDRSFLVSSIVTERLVVGAGAGSTGASTTLFDAEPKYDRATLSMLEIGPRAAASGSRPPNRLTYLTSPLVDPGLVLKFTGHQIARGWAGNPFFHPFVWNGFYLFDLTYDSLGRVITATPVADEAGARPDTYSEPIQLTWFKDTTVLMAVRGMRSGYLRELEYDRTGLLADEKITFPKGGKGVILYDYLSNSPRLNTAKFTDNFWDKRDRIVYFDWASAK